MLVDIGKGFLSKLVDSIYDFARRLAKDKLEKDRINDTVTSHFEKWAKTHEMARLREELDFGGIVQYIEEGYVQEVFTCCTELDQRKQDEKYRAILEKLYFHSKADNQAKRFYINRFAEITKSIVDNIACEYVDSNTKIAISYAIKTNQHNVDVACTSKSNSNSALSNSLTRQRRKIRNQPLISSVPEKLSFGALFEKTRTGQRLYIDSPISMSKSFKKYTGVHSLFRDKKEENLLITGPAGSGKSTGLKALFLSNDSDTTVYYATVKEFWRKDSRSEMLCVMREIIDGNLPSSRTLIILDGLDEAFPNHSAEAKCFVESVLQSNAHVWIGCRENYYSKIAASLKENFDDIAVMEKWNEGTAMLFMTNYADAIMDSAIKERINKVKHQLTSDLFLFSNPFFLTLYLYSIDQDYLGIPKNEYELLSLFLDRWIEAEKIRGTTNIEKDDIYLQLYAIANQLYSGEEPTSKSVDEAIQGLLINRRSKVSAFIHWDFCVYLISRQIVEATLAGDYAVVSYYSQAFLDDVTNMTWEYLESLHPARLQKMYKNLFDVYRQIYEPQATILSLEARKRIEEMDEMCKLKLKDEIIYFSLRLPVVDKSAFFEYASKPERIDHPIIELGLAYGIGMTQSHPFAFAFAQKLQPGTREALLNRSWTVAFFGDQRASNIYDFEENPVASWDMARDARMKRFQENTEKAYRFRLFDIPLLYCFYVSRDWTGCISDEDLDIIIKCDIDWPYYSKQERVFLREKKKELVDNYILFLEYQKSII